MNVDGLVIVFDFDAAGGGFVEGGGAVDSEITFFAAVSAITQSAPPDNHFPGLKVHHFRM